MRNYLKITAILSLMCSTVQAEVDGFFYASAYNLAPYSKEYVDEVFNIAAKTNHAAIIYSNINRPRYPHDSQISYNEILYSKAKEAGASVWLQLRFFDNSLLGDGDITPVPLFWRKQELFYSYLDEIIETYSKQNFDSCRIILFEEAGMYHSPQGGADFWAGGNKHYEGEKLKPSTLFDRIFEYRFIKAYNLVVSRIRTLTDCEVGFHIGHSATYRNIGGVTSIERIIDKVDADFIFYDLYPSASPDFDSYSRKLVDRISRMSKLSPVYYVNQMHTMNNFGHGLGKTPTSETMTESTRLAYESGASLVGWYGKNAAVTQNIEDALDPNTQGQMTVLESSRDRFFYALGITSSDH